MAPEGAWAAHHFIFQSSRSPYEGTFVHPKASHRLLFTSHAPSGACAAHHLATFGSTPNTGCFVHPKASHRLLFTSHASSGA